jgi:hypothetical protein
MSAAYKTQVFDPSILTPSPAQTEPMDIFPLGTFAGSIEKVRYRCNGTSIPSDTSDQLIAAGLM